MQIGVITAALMEEQGLSLEGLAARVRAAGAPNVKYQHIQQLLEIPTRRPRFLPELARAFGLSVEQFLTWKPGRLREPSATGEKFSLPQSQPVGIDPEILAASNQLVRLACDHLEVEHNPEDPEDARITLLGYAYLFARGQRQVTPDNLVDFTKVLRERFRETDESERSTSAGSTGPGSGRKGQARKAS